MSKPSFSRRDFLKLSGYSLIGAFLPGLSTDLPQQDQFVLQGRVLDRTVWSDDEPNIGTKVEIQE